ncbi:MAG: RNA helicase [Firmicutes bacterium HGW-Firmicutes-15]|nr:MAG: RNA helicase [Firmicutes bacterium HGW-Firmicutes-15]
MVRIDFKQYGFSDEILHAIEKLGYENPTDVQEQVLPHAFKGRDLIVQAQTGSGKTAAFAIPICQNIVLEQKQPQVLVLTPTRELAVQVQEEIANIGRFNRIRVAAIYGQQPIYFQRNQLRQRVHIIVATPGRILDHLQRGNVSFEEIRYLVLDEADEMLDMGFIDQVEAILKVMPPDRVTMLFSATMPDAIEKICSQYMRSPKKIEVVSQNPTTARIEQYYYTVEEDDKYHLLSQIINTHRPDSCIVFCHTREKVKLLYHRMKTQGHSCWALHGGMEQRDRLATMQGFKNGEFPFLIATDVAARGIDIEELSLVINYDIPFEKEKYVHRIGRTGRINNEGLAITLISRCEMKMLQEIENYVGYQIPEKALPSLQELLDGTTRVEVINAYRPTPKRDRCAELNADIIKLRINAGKKKNMRPGDILGALTKIECVRACDIGIIDVQDHFSYVDILANKGGLVLEALKDMPIKGKKVNVKPIE